MVYGVDPEKAEGLHNLTKEYRDGFLENKHLQNLLLNTGHPMDDEERPKSFHDIQDLVWHRTIVSVSLQYLDYTMDLATRPQQVIISEKSKTESGSSILTYPFDEPELIVRTPQGYDFEKIEQLQCQWFENSSITETVRKYREKLTESFDEFDLKFILTEMDRTRILLIPDKLKEEFKLQSRIKDAMKNDKYGLLYTALDRAYYQRATMIERDASPLWKTLSETEYGRNFVLTIEETRKLVTKLQLGEY
jgi:hypothetical protein